MGADESRHQREYFNNSQITDKQEWKSWRPSYGVYGGRLPTAAVGHLFHSSTRNSLHNCTDSIINYSTRTDESHHTRRLVERQSSDHCDCAPTLVNKYCTFTHNAEEDCIHSVHVVHASQCVTMFISIFWLMQAASCCPFIRSVGPTDVPIPAITAIPG